LKPISVHLHLTPRQPEAAHVSVENVHFRVVEIGTDDDFFCLKPISAKNERIEIAERSDTGRIDLGLNSHWGKISEFRVYKLLAYSVFRDRAMTDTPRLCSFGLYKSRDTYASEANRPFEFGSKFAAARSISGAMIARQNGRLDGPLSIEGSAAVISARSTLAVAQLVQTNVCFRGDCVAKTILGREARNATTSYRRAIRPSCSYQPARRRS
jgi:hypothetical protein